MTFHLLVMVIMVTSQPADVSSGPQAFLNLLQGGDCLGVVRRQRTEKLESKETRIQSRIEGITGRVPSRR